MPILSEYRQVKDWASFLEYVVTGPLERLQEFEEHARQQLAVSGDHGWVIPIGFSLWRVEKYVDALDILEVGNSLSNSNSQYNVVKGMVARRIPGKESVAKRAYCHALKLEPMRADVYYNLANLLRTDNPSISEKAYLLSLKLDPNAHLTWHNLGLALNEQDKHVEALRAFRKGIVLNPEYPDGWCNAGLALFGMDDYATAIRYFHYTINLDDKNEAGHVNLGYALMNENRPLEALECLKRGVQISSGSVNAIWNLSLIHLMLGNYKEGWDLYEARFKTEQFKSTVYPTTGTKIEKMSQLPSKGEPPVVVWSEQGMGDAIQFCRYLYLLEEKGVPFVFSTREMLFSLMKDWLPYSQRVLLEKTWDRNEDKRPHLALMSLPRIFDTDVHTVPNAYPYLTASNETPSEFLIDKAPGGVNVGLVWASNPDNKAMYRHKTIPLDLLFSDLEELIALDLIQLHSLQVGKDAEQLDKYKKHCGLHDWNGRLNDFSDTAYVISQLDLVISVDTAVAHLSGALGKPTWLLLPANADFRWLLDCSDSPWYPTMRIFRQPGRGDWQSVANEIIEQLKIVFSLDTSALASSKFSRSNT